uniref:3FTx-Lio3 n=1 Tax=Erythrolamprus poecilogyrus TaxID=338838 RepID=A7X3P8_ERYPO|nr:3FTx-Lio3 [Erythrolamprus poecilogyrus]
MKTLLLSLMVVAFVYLDFGQSLICCKGPLCFSSENCPDAKACYKQVSGGETSWGCTTNCTLPEPGETITYCTKDRCT